MSTKWAKPTKYIVGISLAILVVYILYLSRPVLSVLIIAALIAMIVRPIILWLQQRARFPRALAVAAVYLTGIILVPLAVVLAVPAIVTAVNYVLSLDYASTLQGALAWLRSTLTNLKALQLPVESLDMYIDTITDALLAEIQPVTTAAPSEPPPVSTIVRSLLSALSTTFGAVTSLVGVVVSQATLLIFMILSSIYMSVGADRYREWFLNGLPQAYRPEIAILLARISRMWNAFFRGELILMLIIGVLSFVGLSILGVPGAIYLAITAGLLELIPNLGPVIATVPAAIVALLQGSTYLNVSPLVMMALVIGLYWIIQQLENNLIVPRALGDAVELPPLVVMTGVLVGATSAGVLGALLATPVIATGREILRYLYHKMLGSDPYPPDENARADAPALTLRERLDLWDAEMRRWPERARAWGRGRVRRPTAPPPTLPAAEEPVPPREVEKVTEVGKE